MAGRLRDTAGNFIRPDDIVAAALEGSVTDQTLLAAVTAAVTEAMQNVATDAELAAAIAEALESIPEVGDTFVTNLYESNYFSTQIINQPSGLPQLDGNGKVGKGQTRYVDAAIDFVVGDGSSELAAGMVGFVRVPFACTITRVDLLAEQNGSAVVDIWKDTFANHPPTVADSICAAAKPTLSSEVSYSDSVLTGWDTALAAGDVLAFNIDSVATIQNLTIALHLERA